MFRKILLPLDGSPLAEKSCSYAEAMAKQFSAELILGWVIQYPVSVATHYVPEVHGMGFYLDTSSERDRATAYLHSLQEEFARHQVRASVRIIESITLSNGIIDLARTEGVDLIIKTTYARLGVSRWLQGNVAAEVLQHAPCPLFLVRVRDEEEGSTPRYLSSGEAEPV
jgi:nucleotide-binding universal stress UspA family protein